MINRNQGKAGFSVSVFIFIFLQIVVDQFVFFCFNVACIPTENTNPTGKTNRTLLVTHSR